MGVVTTMKSLRPWIQVGLLSVIALWNAAGAVCSEEPSKPAVDVPQPAAVAPEVKSEELSLDEPKPATEKPTEEKVAEEKSAEPKSASDSLAPEPETSLPTTSATPPTGESSSGDKPVKPMDLDPQFEVPIEVNPQSATSKSNNVTLPAKKSELRDLFSEPVATSKTVAPAKTLPTTTEPPVKAQAPVPVIAEPVDPLLQLVNEAIEVSGRRYLTPDGARPHTPWQIIHGTLAYRQDYLLKMSDGRKVNALDWLSSGVSYQGESLFQKTPYGGRAHPFIQAYWFEGHPTQFMAYLTMCRLPLKHEFKTAQGEVITVADIINNAKMEVNRKEEMTWTLWALAHYLEPDAQWVSKTGEPWSIEELVKMEIQNTVYDGPCGGTHSLFATAYARNSYLQTRRPLRGLWLEADQKIQRFVAEARSLQNGDGSFSIHFFKGPGYSNDFNTRITSSGHMIEWLMVALPQSRLSEPWVQNGVRCLAQDLINNRSVNAECGPLYHAVDGLQIYRERMKLAARVANRPEGTSTSSANGWKPAPKDLPRSKSQLNGGQSLDSNTATTDVQVQIAPAAKKIHSTPGVEIVIPQRAKPIQSAEKPSNSVLK
ncbi:MAG: hypothetical protein NT013_17285 [Planctomycetia bacterium]|nr:hypothetical protein [Planctomycetia bacterium]